MMIRFAVPDMHCDACVRAITGAVQGIDPAAQVHVDLTALTVDIQSSQSDDRLAAAIDDAGFTVARTG